LALVISRIAAGGLVNSAAGAIGAGVGGAEAGAGGTGAVPAAVAAVIQFADSFFRFIMSRLV